MVERIRIRNKSGNEMEQANKQTVRLALRELNEPQTNLNIEADYNVCCKALDGHRKWTKNEVANYLKRYQYGSMEDFLEDLDI